MSSKNSFGNKKNNEYRKGVPAQRRAKRRAEAEARNAAFQELTLEAQLLKVTNSPGNSAKQIAKITAAIAARDAAAKREIDETDKLNKVSIAKSKGRRSAKVKTAS